jgi:hypothetical protein
VVERVAARWAFVTVGIAPRLFCYDCENCVTVVHIPLALLMVIVEEKIVTIFIPAGIAVKVYV